MNVYGYDHNRDVRSGGGFLFFSRVRRDSLGAGARGVAGTTGEGAERESAANVGGGD